MVLFLVGIYIFLTVHAANISQIFTENINTIVELTENSDKDHKSEVITFLNAYEGVIRNSVEYIDKEEALKIMEKELNDLFFINQENNPFYNLVRFNVSAQYHSQSYFEKIRDKLQQIEGVHNVYIQNSFFEAVRNKLFKFGLYALVLAILLMLFAITIIYNTIHMALYADKDDIATMKLIGADWFFIKKPYLKQGFKIGLISSFIASVLLILVIIFIHFQLIDLNGIVSYVRLAFVLLIITLIGIVFCLVSTNLILNKFLYRKKSV